MLKCRISCTFRWIKVGLWCWMGAEAAWGARDCGVAAPSCIPGRFCFQGSVVIWALDGRLVRMSEHTKCGRLALGSVWPRGCVWNHGGTSCQLVGGLCCTRVLPLHREGIAQAPGFCEALPRCMPCLGLRSPTILKVSKHTWQQHGPFRVEPFDK